MHPLPQPIDRVLAPTASVGLLLAVVACVIVLTGVADRAVGPIPVIGAGAPALTEASNRSPVVTDPAGTAPGGRSRLIAHRDQRQPQGRFPAQYAATITPMLVDRSRDRRADLMDMAIAIRWHRGAASDLPPGSD